MSSQTGRSCVIVFLMIGVFAASATTAAQSLWAQTAGETTGSPAASAPRALDDPEPQRYKLQGRASVIDPRTRQHPDIDFVFADDGKPQDLQNASVDTRVAPQGKLMIWLMGYNDALFQRVNSYGIHAIQVSYANKWFGKLLQPSPPDSQARGNVRLEAAIGEDVSDAIDIPKPDSMAERSLQFVRWLAKEHPQGRWEQFLTDDGQELRWDKVIIAGSSHGATTAARFAIHQRVDRVVMFCGPRDQDQDWQALPIYAKNFLGIPDGRIGLFLGANGLMVIVLQLPISYAIDRTSKVWALLVGAALFAASSATLLLTESFWGILVAFALFFTLAEMILEVAGAALATDLAPVRLRGTYLALFGACFGAAYGASPIVAGALLQARLPDLIWQLQLAAAVLAAAALVVLKAISKKAED
jgi:hypothetical protein